MKARERGAVDIHPGVFSGSWSLAPRHWAFARLLAAGFRGTRRRGPADELQALALFLLWEWARGSAREALARGYLGWRQGGGAALLGEWLSWVEPVAASVDGALEVDAAEHGGRLKLRQGSLRAYYFAIVVAPLGRHVVVLRPIPAADVRSWPLAGDAHRLELAEWQRYYTEPKEAPLTFGEPRERLELGAPELLETFDEGLVARCQRDPATRSALARVFPGVDLPKG